jgi:hypothetical protein
MQRHAYMLRIAVPYGLLSTAQMRMFAHIARKLRPRLRPLHHAPEHPVQLDRAGADPGHPDRPGLGRDARDPDLGQLHPQHHDRRIRRRGRGRDHRSAPVRRDPAPVEHLPPRIHRPAAQVQDRRQRRRRGPRRDRRARHRPDRRACNERRSRLQVHGRRRHGPHPDPGQRHQRFRALAAPADLHGSDHARVQPVRPPRQQVQGAHQDPGESRRRRGIRAHGRSRICRPQGRSGNPDARGSRPRGRLLQPAALQATLEPSIRAPAMPTTKPSPTGCSATSSRTRCRATPPSCCR